MDAHAAWTGFTWPRSVVMEADDENKGNELNRRIKVEQKWSDKGGACSYRAYPDDHAGG